jgi:hypothetical protein
MVEGRFNQPLTVARVLKMSPGCKEANPMSQTDSFESLVDTLTHMHLLFVPVDGMVNHSANSLDSYQEELCNVAMLGQDLVSKAKAQAEDVRRSHPATATTD